MSSNKFMIAFSLSLAIGILAHGHGMLCTPRQRGGYQSEKCGSNVAQPMSPVVDYCAHCLNGGTVAEVRKHLPHIGWLTYDPINNFNLSATRAGLCGDAKGSNHHMIDGDFMPYEKVPIVAKYKTGGVVDFMVEIDTNHNGYFEFFLCNLDECNAADISENCFTGGACHKLIRVPHPDCQKPSRKTEFQCGPIDRENPGRFYVPCRMTGQLGVHYVGGSAGTMRYKLPNGVRCHHCVIQWYWATANSCAPPMFLRYFENYDNPFGTRCDGDGGAKGAHRKGMAECGRGSVPEEFWSCADVQITDEGKASGQITAVQETGAGPAAGLEPLEDEGPSGESENRTQEEMTGAIEEIKKKLIEVSVQDFPMSDSKPKPPIAYGPCVLADTICDGSKFCCDNEDVCVYVPTKSSFICRKWWSLWEMD